MKQLINIIAPPDVHWVGDGFPVRSMFSYRDAAQFDPFLLLDYAGPTEFPPSDNPRGVESHPHKGFETVTIVYSGEVEHRDSTGGGGLIGPGDVQWMTAASGLVHEEMHGREFTKRGGIFALIQLWVNLPAKDKKASPHYQSISSKQIPQVQLPNDAGLVRVIAGRFHETVGPGNTYTPINLWDVQMNAESTATLPTPSGHNTFLLVMDGRIELSGGNVVENSMLATFESQGDSLILKASEKSKLLILTGQPINEPVAAYGPFVMNTQAEIRQAIEEFQSGRMGQLSKLG